MSINEIPDECIETFEGTGYSRNKPNGVYDTTTFKYTCTNSERQHIQSAICWNTMGVNEIPDEYVETFEGTECNRNKPTVCSIRRHCLRI